MGCPSRDTNNNNKNPSVGARTSFELRRQDIPACLPWSHDARSRAEALGARRASSHGFHRRSHDLG